MNWRRGLFRCWVALSILWIIGIIVVAWAAPTLISTTYLRQPTADEVAKCNELAPSKPPPGFTLDMCAAPIVERSSWYVAIALGFPLLALALGLSIRWVVAGFNR
jgi:hypothetical protein